VAAVPSACHPIQFPGDDVATAVVAHHRPAVAGLHEQLVPRQCQAPGSARRRWAVSDGTRVRARRCACPVLVPGWFRRVGFADLRVRSRAPSRCRRRPGAAYSRSDGGIGAAGLPAVVGHLHDANARRGIASGRRCRDVELDAPARRARGLGSCRGEASAEPSPPAFVLVTVENRLGRRGWKASPRSRPPSRTRSKPGSAGSAGPPCQGRCNHLNNRRFSSSIAALHHLARKSRPVARREHAVTWDTDSGRWDRTGPGRGGT